MLKFLKNLGKKIPSPRQPGELPENLQEKIFQFLDEREIFSKISEWPQSRVLEIAPRMKTLAVRLREKGTRMSIFLGSGKEKAVDEQGNLVVSHWENLPFQNKSLDIVLLRTPFFRLSKSKMLRETVRVLKDVGTVCLTDLHPFSVVTQKDFLKSPGTEEGLPPSFERYLKWFEDAGLALHGVREVFIDGSLKKFFATEEQKKAFEKIRKTPIFILFILKKK